MAGGDAVKLLDAWKKQFPNLKLSCIGKIVAGEGITIRDKTGAHHSTLMATFISHSPAETESLGEPGAARRKRGLVIALSGDLGAGKTQLVKGSRAGWASRRACIRRRSRW